MSLDIFNIDEDVQVQDERDSTGGYQPWDSDIHDTVCKVAFLDQWASGSDFIELHFENADGKRYTHRETITNRERKNFYIDKKTSKKMQMPGFAKMNQLHELIAGVPLKGGRVEDKMVNIYDKTERKEVPKPRKVLMNLVGKRVHLGIIQIEENKQVDSGQTDDTGKKIYVATAETRIVNDIDKFFNEKKQTNLEVKASTEAKFYQDWLKSNKDQIRDKVNKSIASTPSDTPLGQAKPLNFE